MPDNSNNKINNDRSNSDAGYQDGSVNRCLAGIHKTAKANIKLDKRFA
jgi:hypothetical protein